jgi:hypothetical protein
MGPHDIDDVPRREEREETRQLMLGLIDELPHQERRGILLIKILGLGLLIALFIVLVWITAPSGQPG